MFKIMLDPGHGGKDPGAVGNGLQEKNIVLEIAKMIKAMLLNEYEGIAVKMTRETDVFYELSDRAKMANEWGADYFMAIHVNAGAGSGFESYIHPSRSSTTVQALNAIHAEIIKQLQGVVDRGKKSANYAVLRETKMPAILTENLFIDHSADASKLKDKSFLKKLARGHVLGLEKAFNLKRKAASPPQEEKKPNTPAPKDETALAIEKLQKAGIINTPEYWLKNAKQDATVRGDYAAALIQKMAEKLK